MSVNAFKKPTNTLKKLASNLYADDQFKEVKEKVNNAIGSDAYSNSKSYAVGDTCIDDNTLWKCILACSGVRPSTDSGTYWEKISLSSIANKFDYSNDEIIVGTWLGKTRYSKVFSITYNNVAGTSKNVVLGSIPQGARAVNFGGSVRYSTGTVMPVNRANPFGNEYALGVSALASNEIQIQIGSGAPTSTMEINVIVEYTK